MKTNIFSRLMIAIVIIIISLFSYQTGLLLAKEKAASGDGSKVNAEYVGRQTCGSCHADYADAFNLTAHSKDYENEKDSANQCESCHGPGSEHVNAGGGKTMIINPGALNGYKASSLCIRCHEDKPGQYSWRFSKHAAGGVSCSDCHTAHGKDKKELSLHQLKGRGEPELCFTCHVNVKAETNLPSHHPISEGRMNCSDCHNAHGSEMTAYKNAPDGRELCLSCHSQYRGPFASEHQPVSENCITCHKPHGAIEDNLLQTSEPFLCMRCHPATHNQHVPAAVIDNDRLRSDVLFYSRCSICHPDIHGSEQTRTFTR